MQSSSRLWGTKWSLRDGSGMRHWRQSLAAPPCSWHPTVYNTMPCYPESFITDLELDTVVTVLPAGRPPLLKLIDRNGKYERNRMLRSPDSNTLLWTCSATVQLTVADAAGRSDAFCVGVSCDEHTSLLWLSRVHLYLLSCVHSV